MEVILHDPDRLACVDLVPLHAMTAKVLNALDRESLVADGHLVRLHCFLNLLTVLVETPLRPQLWAVLSIPIVRINLHHEFGNDTQAFF